MERRETKVFKAVRNGLCLFLMAGIVACNTGKEVVEDGVILDDIEKEEVDVSRGDVTVAETWDENEFYTTFSNTILYENWDVNGDGFLNEAEFTAGFLQTWDIDNDGRVSQSEWNTAVADYAVDPANWQAWDTDGDGFIEEAEFETEFNRIGWYDAWDLDDDALLTEQEYTSGVFKIWDTNGDNVLDDTEYRRLDTYYGN